jgi:hypothetical protein
VDSLKDNVLNLIACLPDTRKEISCVICDHLRHTLDSANTDSETQADLHDKCNVTNNLAAVAFLLDSLTPVLLAETTSDKLEETDSFHVVWLELMNKIQVQRIERIEAIKKEIKDRRLQQHPGQDLEKLAVHFCAGALELQNAGQHEHNLTLLTLSLTGGGGDKG